MKQALESLSSDVDGKLDRLEFDPVRCELEAQLRSVAEKLASFERDGRGAPAEDDAAGIRKQMLLRFNCISCDKPVQMTPRKYVRVWPTFEIHFTGFFSSR